MTVTVVIPAKNEERNIGKLLQDLRRQTVQPRSVIIADAKSTDRTVSIARKYGCKIVAGGLPGAGRNRGARAARSDYLLFLDADVRLPDPNFIETSLGEMRRRKLDAASVNNLPGWVGSESVMQKAYLHLSHAITNTTIRIMSVTGAPGAIGTCILFRTESFRRIGGFDERILWEEDTEIMERASARGCRFGMLHTSVVASTRRILEQGTFRFYYEAVRLYLYRKRHGEITSWKTYKKLTGREDYFTFLRFRA